MFAPTHQSAAVAGHAALLDCLPGHDVVAAAVCGRSFYSSHVGSSPYSIANISQRHSAYIAALSRAAQTSRFKWAAAHSSFLICVFMVHIFWPSQPVTQPVNQSIFAMGRAMYQSEISMPRLVANPSWVDEITVKGWGTWRDAVLWCWKNRPHRGMNENGDQSTFRLLCERAYKVKVHAPHVSRWVNPHTKAPMDLPPDLVSAFEEFTGWRGLTQFFNRRAKATCLEEMQQRLAA